MATKPKARKLVLPEEASHIWDAWLSIRAAVGGNGFGPMPIPYSEINAWQVAVDYRLDPWEVEAVRFLDSAYIAAQDVKAEEAKTK